MEKIKFRAKSLFSGNFIKGNYLKTVFKDGEDNHKIYPFLYNVPPEDIDVKTLGQFTGLKDKNGTDIYEGDKTKDGYVIMWHDKKALFAELFYQGFTKKWEVAAYPIDARTIEIIGNIHEN